MTASQTNNQRKKRGFTLVELMVVVTIIGLIASIAIPALTQSRQQSIAARTANDFRKFAEQFNYFNLKTGTWPNDGYPTTVPTGMEEYLLDGVWPKETPVGGYWDYDRNVFGFTSGISIDSATHDDEALRAIDALMDDGDLTTGLIIKTGGNRLSYILEE